MSVLQGGKLFCWRGGEPVDARLVKYLDMPTGKKKKR